MKKPFAVILVLSFFSLHLYAQPLALICSDAIPICNFDDIDGLTFDMPQDNSPGEQPNPLCGGMGQADNISWIAFTAQTGEYTIQVSAKNCTGSIIGEGFQLGIYTDCSFYNEAFCANGPVIDTVFIPSNLFIPGEDYFMYIDGYASNICEISIEIIGDYGEDYCEPCGPVDSLDTDPRISGHAYIDSNLNGHFDSNEETLPNVLISIDPGNFMTLTDDEGKYIFSVPEGTYNLKANINEGEWVSEELYLNTIETLVDCNQDNNFGFIPIINSSSYITVANSLLRCDWETKFTIAVANTGFTPIENATLQFEFDNKATFFGSDHSSLSVVDNIATTSISIQPYHQEEIIVTLKMPAGSSNLPILNFEATLINQENELLAEYTYSEQLKCSYDPNDKRTYPDREGSENLTLLEEAIEYTIRFQNNGNAEAYDIRIVDALDPNIDPSSIRVLNSSHSVETIIDNNLLIFLFENINLPDSASNYIESQGFVTFRCNAIDGIADYTEIFNSADIIFDTNPPITTNTEINTMVSVLCIDKFTELEINICQGEQFAGHTESGEYMETYDIPFGCDSVVSIILDVQEIVQVNESFIICEGLDLEFNGEVYAIDSSTTIFDTLVNDAGCPTDLIMIEVEIQEVEDIIVDTTICEGYSYLGFEETGTYYIDTLDEETGCNALVIINLDVLPLTNPSCIVDVSEIHTSNLLVYPNPTTDKIFIQLESGIKNISILDIGAQRIFQQDLKNAPQNFEVNVEGWPTGLYLIQIQSENGTAYSKIIVE